MEKLNDAIKRKIEEETGLVADKVKDDLDVIRKWVNQLPHLPTLEDDEETNEWLYNFLFYSKNRIEKVKKHLEAYYSCKSLMPEFYENRDPESCGIKANVQALYLVTLPKLTPEGYRVHVFCHSNEDPNAYEPKEFMRRALMMCDWKLKKDLTAGDIVIMHMKHSTLAYWSRYNLVTLSRFVAAIMGKNLLTPIIKSKIYFRTLLQNCVKSHSFLTNVITDDVYNNVLPTFYKYGFPAFYLIHFVTLNAYPLRIKAIHFTLAPSFLSHIINNPIISSKLKKRIRVHTNITELLEDIPNYCLPQELGGTLPTTLKELNDSTYKNILDMKEWFLAHEKEKSDESKRPPHLKDNSLFGCDGTFRTLALD